MKAWKGLDYVLNSVVIVGQVRPRGNSWEVFLLSLDDEESLGTFFTINDVQKEIERKYKGKL